MHVLATAGHVDHGKSTLVRALTGMEPDRWEAERRRGLTIDLGYAWTTLPGGDQLVFVDVPGHRRFIGNMLAGLGPAPGVVLVVAADAGWSAQSAEHLRAVEAFGIDRGLLVVTRADLADPAPAMAQARERLAGGSLSGCEALAVSAVSGAGMDELRAALGRLVAAMPAAPAHDRVRLWVDRAFSIAGAGTVVTGTLEAGTIRAGDELDLLAPRPGQPSRPRRLRVRGLHALGRPRESVSAPARVAVNLRGVPADVIVRGDALLTPGAWRTTAVLDARYVVTRPDTAPDLPPPDLPTRVTLHVGTAAPIVHLRPLGGAGTGAQGAPTGAVRLTLPAALPLVAGDRALLRDPGDASGEAIVGLVVADADPPALRRRGEGARRGAELAARTAPGRLDLATEVGRRGAMRVGHARDLGLDPHEPGARLVRHGEWLVAPPQWEAWGRDLHRVTAAQAAHDPLDPAIPLDAARAACDLPDRALVTPLAGSAGLAITDGRVHLPGIRPDLGAAEAGLRAIEQRLADSPFAAPEADELLAAGLGARQLAAALATGRLLRLADSVYVQPVAPAKAMRVLAGLSQPFTTSEARQALGTTRRVAIPLLEHLDARGWTRRLDAGHRTIAR